MIYLILAVTSSMLVSVIMRVSEKHIHNNITMLASNYLMCSVLAAICTGTWNLFPVSAEGFPFSVGLGLISGLFYMGSFMLLQWNVKTNGIVLSSMFMKLGVMVPTLMAILVFGEVPKAVQVIGMIVALAAILLINLEKGSGKAASSLGLVLLLVAGGATDAMSKVYEELGVSALKNHFLLYTFMMAFALCVVSGEKAGRDERGRRVRFGDRHSEFLLGAVPAALAGGYPRDDRVSDVQRRGHRHGDACGRGLL